MMTEEVTNNKGELLDYSKPVSSDDLIAEAYAAIKSQSSGLNPPPPSGTPIATTEQSTASKASSQQKKQRKEQQKGSASVGRYDEVKRKMSSASQPASTYPPPSQGYPSQQMQSSPVSGQRRQRELSQTMQPPPPSQPSRQLESLPSTQAPAPYGAPVSTSGGAGGTMSPSYQPPSGTPINTTGRATKTPVQPNRPTGTPVKSTTQQRGRTTKPAPQKKSNAGSFIVWIFVLFILYFIVRGISS